MSTMEPLPTPALKGYHAALARVMADDLFSGEPDNTARRAAQRAVEDAAQVLSGDEPDRYVSLYAELAAIGAFARARYDEKPLEQGVLQTFNEQLKRLLNSWVHRHGRD